MEQPQTETTNPSQFAELLETGLYWSDSLRPGDIKEAKILSITDSDLMVDVGAKRDGIVTQHDLRMVSADYVAGLRVGDTIPVAVLRRPHDDGVHVSLNKGLENADWLRAASAQESGEIVEAVADEPNRGGLVVRFGRARGFVPNSHLGTLVGRRGSPAFDESKVALEGKTLELVVIEVDRRRRRLVLSRKPVERRQRQDLLAEIEPGQTRTGTVASLADFGAFVDLGGIDGLVHISELAWQRVNHPRQVVSMGDEIEVEVLRVDHERERISLSRKRLLPEPWDLVTAELEPGDVVTGTVANTAEFGAFVDLGHGIEGLLHESELPLSSMAAHNEIVAGVGLVVRVLSIDEMQHRISLGYVELEPVPEPVYESEDDYESEPDYEPEPDLQPDAQVELAPDVLD